MKNIPNQSFLLNKNCANQTTEIYILTWRVSILSLTIQKLLKEKAKSLGRTTNKTQKNFQITEI